ncbi:MAG TPA: dTMP kinase [Phycisphaerae bacterium]|nr:dTMP kinase [Phycisphaerae bacterium]
MSDLADKLAGKFIVIDGPDGAGKTTQIELLAEQLRGSGLKVCTTRDPGGTAIGDKIRAILLDKANGGMAVECETMLYMASRAQLVSQVIRPALSRSECVLCDRYVSATVAYQGAGGADPAAIRAVGEVAVGGLWPDLTIVLDLPADVGLKRLTTAPDRMESKDRDFHARVRELFLQQAADEPARFAVIDASGSVHEVQQRLLKAIREHRFA